MLKQAGKSKGDVQLSVKTNSGIFNRQSIFVEDLKYFKHSQRLEKVSQF
ncbi:hypothetical protein QUB01_13370 [Microcoleus sp. CZ3-B4]